MCTHTLPRRNDSDMCTLSLLGHDFINANISRWGTVALLCTLTLPFGTVAPMLSLRTTGRCALTLCHLARLVNVHSHFATRALLRKCALTSLCVPPKQVGQALVIAVGLLSGTLLCGYMVSTGVKTLGDFVLFITYIVQLYGVCTNKEHPLTKYPRHFLHCGTRKLGASFHKTTVCPVCHIPPSAANGPNSSIVRGCP
jgi:hypothetical protein